MQTWHVGIVRLALATVLCFAAGCASHQQDATEIEDIGIERPAVPLEEEETLTDKIGQVGIVLIAVGVLVGGIVASLFAFGAL